MADKNVPFRTVMTPEPYLFRRAGITRIDEDNVKAEHSYYMRQGSYKGTAMQADERRQDRIAWVLNAELNADQVDPVDPFERVYPTRYEMNRWCEGF